ncbi:MAG TPA: thiamine pyrophosphate-dependent enzyme [Aurantimonas sp.]|uniref:Thiamine pyrophosphate-dependent enzyme n=1 Tax=Aurantimonas marianensis TaxID=2920428 RepID=A0A9X2H6S8_9HYPH|nr:thiamine pyrophosphate-dependent enzyme [Aurantimonas marianensis]MCP3055261.1 thiamine pyrophosphate-dependent enzyme [Aurantimonas marianensis]
MLNSEFRSGDEESQIRRRAELLACHDSVDAALAAPDIEMPIETSLSEALVIGLLKQGVTHYFAIFGHGSTDLGNVLRIYSEAGVVTVINCRNEVEMAHAATAHAWQYGKTPAVVTSIGPGGLQAMAGSLAAASNGVGVYHIYGDETTRGEGYNMQQVPKPEQGIFGKITALMGQSHTLHTPESLRECMRRGTNCVHHPYMPGPFFILLPINTQPQSMKLNVETLPGRMALPAVAPAGAEAYAAAAALLGRHRKVVIKAGGGARRHASAVRDLAEAIGAAVVLSPGSTGVLPDDHPQNMHVGGSKGTISGNYAMEEADLVVFVGSRGVCQADCSGVGYPNAKAVININGAIADVTHYANTLPLPGDIGCVAGRLLDVLREKPALKDDRGEWLRFCADKKAEWRAFKRERTGAAPLEDSVWKQPVLTQPAAIHTVAEFAKRIGAAKFFDAGDVQANGFQIVEDDTVGDTFTETGASYMGFAASALLGSAGVKGARYGIAFTGDGSFMMNPQILIDAVEHGVKGMVALFDNRRMGAITSLQYAQYGQEFRTNDSVAVDYVAMAGAFAGVKALFGGTTRDTLRAALDEAHAHDGLSLVHIPVYAGRDPIAEMGAYGSWNVGNWVDDVQARYLEQKI